MLRISEDWRARVYKVVDTMTREEQEAWRKLRASVLERDDFTCYRCEKRSANGKGLSVHHLTPRDEGGPDALNNLVTLCNPCHDYVELEGLRTRAAIAGSYDKESPSVDEEEYIPEREETFKRPLWHKVVYGGQRQHRKGR